MALVTRFETPGRLRDLPAGSSSTTNGARGLAAPDAKTPGAGDVGGFFDPSETDVQVVGQRDLVWMGFPRRLLVGAGDRQAAFEQGDVRGDRRWSRRAENPGRVPGMARDQAARGRQDHQGHASPLRRLSTGRPYSGPTRAGWWSCTGSWSATSR